jgi:hypothetical protein
VDQIRQTIAERFQKSMRKAAQKEARETSKKKTTINLSTSESESSHILRCQQKKHGGRNPISLELIRIRLQTSRKHGERETTAASEGIRFEAKELFKDAEAAKEVHSKFEQELTEIQRFQCPEGKLCYQNFDSCLSDDAMFRCHPCGFAFCLNCRCHGKACDHPIVNYSSELGEQFMPDSIGSEDPPFDIDEIIDNVLEHAAFFGSARSEQDRTRKKTIEDIVETFEKRKQSWQQLFPKFCSIWC